MLSTSSPSTTRTDWAGLKWNWNQKHKTNATFISNSEVFSRSSCLTGLFFVMLPATHKSSAVFYFYKAARSCCSTNQRMSYSQCPCVHFKDWEPIPIPFPPSTHLNVLSEAFKGVNIQAFFAGLQTGDNFLGFNAAGSDRQTRQAAVEILREPRGRNLTT